VNCFVDHCPFFLFLLDIVLSVLLLVIVLSVLRFTHFYYPVGIFFALISGSIILFFYIDAIHILLVYMGYSYYFGGHRVTHSWAFCVVYCRSSLVFLSLFCMPLYFYPSIHGFWLLLLVSTNLFLYNRLYLPRHIN
jgi:hypothetical protein